MDANGNSPPRRWVSMVVVLTAIVVAAMSARNYAGSWNDRSRLATVECLVDYHALAIDRSIFTPDTSDKLFIDGRFYSDKGPVPALLLAGGYQIAQATTGLNAREQPEAFCYWMNLISSGL